MRHGACVCMPRSLGFEGATGQETPCDQGMFWRCSSRTFCCFRPAFRADSVRKGPARKRRQAHPRRAISSRGNEAKRAKRRSASSSRGTRAIANGRSGRVENAWYPRAMSEALHACDGCGRHVRANDERCPFCARARGGLSATATKVAAVAATIAVGVALSACYGGPPRHDNLDRQMLDGAPSSTTPTAQPPASSK